MRREIHDLQRMLGLTTVFVTHDQEEANTIADRMAVLDQGVIQQVGTPMELYDNPSNLFVAEFLGSVLRYQIGVNGHSILVDEHHRRKEPPHLPGTEIHLLFDPDEMVALAE